MGAARRGAGDGAESSRAHADSCAPQLQQLDMRVLVHPAADERSYVGQRVARQLQVVAETARLGGVGRCVVFTCVR